MIAIPASVGGGMQTATVVLMDNAGSPRGPVVSVDVMIPEDGTLANVPINATAAVVLS